MSMALMRFETFLLTEKRVSKNTFDAYKRDIKQLITFLHITHKAVVESCTAEQVKSFLYHLKELNLSARTMARKISSLKVFFSYTSKYLGTKNHATDLHFPKIDKKLPRYLSELELKKLFQVAELDTTDIGVRNKVMLFLLYVSGMRITELTTLTISQVHFDSKVLAVAGKGGKGRHIPIPDSILDLLKKYITDVLHKFLDGGKKHNKGNYLFPVYYGGKMKPISRQSFWFILKELWEKTGSDKVISPHQLRHSLATHMLKNGADIRSLQLLLGHENLSTVQIYTHLDTNYLREVYDKKHSRS